MLGDTLFASDDRGIGIRRTVAVGKGPTLLSYQKLLWFSQHPDRQRRELGLAVWNEFGLNCRIHPLAALGANAVFESSLEALAQRRVWPFRVIDRMNVSGYIEPIAFEEQRIEPSFFRLTASWKSAERLGPSGVAGGQWHPRADRAVARALGVPPPAFLAQYSVEKPLCPIAESQENTRFCVRRQPIQTPK
jgi:hypothetical protein